MDRVLSSKTVKARKPHHCDACYWWHRSGYTVDDCDDEDQKAIVLQAEADSWKILPGHEYIKATGVHEGRLSTYRARPGMDYVCRALGLFDD